MDKDYNKKIIMSKVCVYFYPGFLVMCYPWTVIINTLDFCYRFEYSVTG